MPEGIERGRVWKGGWVGGVVDLGWLLCNGMFLWVGWMVGWLLGGCEMGHREGGAGDLERGIFWLVVREGLF